MDNYRKFNSGHTDRANNRDPYSDQKNSRQVTNSNSQTDRVVSDTRNRVNGVLKK